MNILVFGFKGNVSEEILAKLNNTATKYTLISDETEIYDFVKNTKFNDFDYILGMGAYTGSDTNRIRIETVYSSQFRNDKKDNRSIIITPFLHESQHFKITKRIGNSYCNLVSYLIASRHPEIPYSFLHIPKNYPLLSAVDAINEQLESLG